MNSKQATGHHSLRQQADCCPGPSGCRAHPNTRQSAGSTNAQKHLSFISVIAGVSASQPLKACHRFGTSWSLHSSVSSQNWGLWLGQHVPSWGQQAATSVVP